MFPIKEKSNHKIKIRSVRTFETICNRQYREISMFPETILVFIYIKLWLPICSKIISNLLKKIIISRLNPILATEVIYFYLNSNVSKRNLRYCSWRSFKNCIDLDFSLENLYRIFTCFKRNCEKLFWITLHY